LSGLVDGRSNDLSQSLKSGFVNEGLQGCGLGDSVGLCCGPSIRALVVLVWCGGRALLVVV
jgi:hypothetical protein